MLARLLETKSFVILFTCNVFLMFYPIIVKIALETKPFGYLEINYIDPGNTNYQKNTLIAYSKVINKERLLHFLAKRLNHI